MNVPPIPTQETLLAYVEGELLPAQARLVEAYLLHDPVLRQQVDGMKRDLAGMRALPQLKAPATLMKGVLERLDGIPGERLAGSDAPIPFETAANKKHKLFTAQVIGLSGLAAAATVAVTLGLVYFNAPPVPAPATVLPNVPGSGHIAMKAPVTPEVVNTDPGVENANTIDAGMVASKDLAPEAGVDDLALMTQMAQDAQPEEEPVDPMFVVDLPRSDTGRMASLDSLPAEPGKEYEGTASATKAIHEIAVRERPQSDLKVNDTSLASLITPTGSPAPSMIDRPAVGPSMAEMTPESSDVAGMQVRTVNLGFASVDKGQKAVLDWAGNNQIRVLSNQQPIDTAGREQMASQIRPSPGNMAPGTRELRLVVTQEQMESLLSGVTVADAGGMVIPATTGLVMAARSANTAVASMDTPPAKGTDGATTQPATEGKKLFVLQVLVNESGR